MARGDIPLFLILGQLGISVYFWLQYTGVQLTNAGISSVLVVGLIPLATMVISGLMLKEPLGGRRATALVLGAVGVAVVVSQRGWPWPWRAASSWAASAWWPTPSASPSTPP